jgi:CRP-like cAMP-binding protein
MSLLRHRALKAAARETLVGYGEPIVPALAHALLDRDEAVWIRRHIPSTLALIPSQRSVDALVAALTDPDGFLRYKAIAALEKLRRDNPHIHMPRGILERLVIAETSRYYNYLTLQYNLVEHSSEARASLVGQALADKLRRTLDRIYRLLGLLHRIEDVAAARFTIEQGEARRRAAAIEYLDNLLGGAVRKRVLPILDETPIAEKVRTANLVLKSRPRDLNDTLAQLVHEDDAVLAASAIHFVARYRLWALAEDLEYVLARRTRQDRAVLEAAAWALTQRHASSLARPVRPGSVPAVDAADRVRSLPLFEFISVDELFRISEQGEEVHAPAGRELWRIGDEPPGVLLLLAGSVRAIDARGRSREVPAPAVLGLDEVMQGLPGAATIRAIEDVVCLRIDASQFLTMVADNVLLAEGLFRMFLLPRIEHGDGPGVFVPAHPLPEDGRAQPLQPIDLALLLRQHPLLARATAPHLMAIVAAAREVPFTRGATIFDAADPAALYVVVEGALALDARGAPPVPAPRGATIGLAETLAGAACGARGSGMSDGRLLRLERDDIFLVLGDQVELTRALFTGVLNTPAREPLAPASRLAGNQ